MRFKLGVQKQRRRRRRVGGFRELVADTGES
jgi:hypothetical protein